MKLAGRVLAMSHSERTTVLFCVFLVAAMAAKHAARPEMHSVYPTYANVGMVSWTGENAAETPPAAYVRQQYGPIFADLVAPFAMMPERLGGAAWSACSLIVLMSGFRRLLDRLVPQLDRRQRMIAYLLMPWCGLASVYNGQVNVLIVGCLLWGVALVRERRWNLAGLLLAVPVCIKVYPVAVPLLMIVLYPRKLTAPFLASLAALSLLPFCAHPVADVVERYETWFAFLVSGRHYMTGLVVIDVRTFLARWFVTVAPQQFLAVQLLAAGLVAACVLARARCVCDHRATLLHGYTLGSFWMVLFGPASEEATFLLIGPPVAVLMADLNGQRTSLALRTCLLAAFLFAGPLQTSILGETVRSWVLDCKLAPAAVSILFAVALARCIRPILPAIPDPLHGPVTRPA